jgi:hypothetical protein
VKVGVGVAMKLNCPLHAGRRITIKMRAMNSFVRIIVMVSVFGEMLDSQLVIWWEESGTQAPRDEGLGTWGLFAPDPGIGCQFVLAGGCFVPQHDNYTVMFV